MTKRNFVALSGIMVLATLLRLHRINDRSLWVDEIYSITQRGSHSIPEIIFAPTIDTHPPLHYILLHIWMETFGHSAVSARVHAVLIGVVTVGAMYLLGRRLFSNTVGLLAALFLALSPMHINASREVRMYGLLVLLTILSLYFFVRISEERSLLNGILYVGTAAALLLTHPYAVFVILAQNVYVLLAVTRFDRRPVYSLPDWVLMQLSIGIVALPGLYRMLELVFEILTGSQEGMVGWIATPHRYVLLETWRAFAGLPRLYPFLPESIFLQWVATVVLLISVIGLGAAFGDHESWVRAHHLGDQGVDEVYLLFLVLLSVTILPYILSFVVTPVYLIRSTVPGIVPFFLLMTFGISRLSVRHAQTILVGIVVVVFLVSSGAYLSVDSEEPYQQVADDIGSEATAEDLIALHPWWIEDSLGYYWDQGPGPPNATVVDYQLQLEYYELSDLQSRSAEHDTIWFVTRDRNAAQSALDSLNATHEMTAQEKYGHIYVYRYEI